MSSSNNYSTHLPFVYRLEWYDDLGNLTKIYIGCRYSQRCHPNDLWTKYYTSSNHVAQYRRVKGEPLVKKIIKTFTGPDANLKCLAYEHKMLRRLKVASRPIFLNACNGCSTRLHKRKKLVIVNVYEWSATGILLNIYPSVQDCARANRVDPTLIYKCLSRKTPGKLGHNLMWTTSPQISESQLHLFQEWAEKSQPYRYRSVYQWSLDGVLIQQYDSPAAAAKSIGGTGACIVDCCNNKQTQHSHFLWSWDNKPPKPAAILERGGQGRAVIGPDGLVFNSVREAGDHYKVPRGDISAVCSGRQRTARGLKFQYLN